MTYTWWRLALPLLVVAGCRTDGLPRHPTPLPQMPRSASAPAGAARIEKTETSVPGVTASGRPGDFLLQNDTLAAVVSGIGRRPAGAVLDAVLKRKGSRDSLGSLAPVLGRGPLHAPGFHRLEIEKLGGTATVRLLGQDPTNTAVKVTHEYTVHPESALLRITTTLVNRGKTALLQYRVGDRIDWGTTLSFAPGLGRAPRGTPSLAWIAGWSEDVSYAYYRRGGAMAGTLSPQVATVILETLELPPGERVVIQRLLAVGPGGHLADLLPGILRTQGVGSGRLDVTVRGESGEHLPGATLDVALGGRPFAVGRSGEDGTASIFLPAGHYQVRAHTEDRTTPSAPVGIRPDRVSGLGLRSGGPSRLVFDVRQDGSDAPLPVKLTVEGMDGTPSPWLGPLGAPRAANSLLSETGKGVLPLPPGRYRITASRGPQHTVHAEPLRLPPHGGASFVARLRRVVTTPGYVSIDTTQRTLRSPGCSVDMRCRTLGNRVEGLAGAVLADVDHVPRPDERQLGQGLVTLAGLGHRSERIGWLTLFPVSIGMELPDDLDRLLGRTTAPSDMVVQLDSARRPGRGLFSRLEYDPDHPMPDAVPPAVNALRILDGRHPEDFDRLLDDWMSQLRLGRRLVATGGSGSGSLHESEAGYPRTYVAVPKLAAPGERPAQVVGSLLEGRAVVSSGPFILLSAGGAAPGETLSIRRRQRVVEVQVSVLAPAWIGLDSLTLYVDGKPWEDPIPIPGRADGERLKQTLRVPVTRDSFIVAVARGSAPMTPVVNSPGVPLPPIAVTNPVWIDVE